MRNLFVLLTVLLLPLSAQAQIIKLAGSTTIEAYVQLAREAYIRLHPEVRVDVTGGGSGVGIARIEDQSAHIGMVSRELTAEELAKLSQVQVVKVGLDAVAVIVSEHIYTDAGVRSLSREQLAAIYRGDISNWRAVGGPDREILLVDKEMERGTRHVFTHYLFENATQPIARSAVVVGPNSHMSTLVRTSDQAIGFVTAAEVGDSLYPLALRVNGIDIEPSAESMRSGEYPLVRSLYLLVPKNSPAYVQNFVDFMTSKQAYPILKQAGYLPPN